MFKDTYINSQIAGQKLKEILQTISQALRIQNEINIKQDKRNDDYDQKYFDLLDRIQKIEDYLLTKDNQNASNSN